MKVVLTTLNAKYIHSSLALRYLKSYCNSRLSGVDVIIKEYTINNELLVLISDIYSQKPDILAIACYIWNIEMSLQLVELIKKVLPEVIIVLGGPEVSYNAGDVLSEYKEVNYIIQGEGEESFSLFINAIKQGLKVDNIPGLAYRKGNTIEINGGCQVVADLVSIPFPYDEEDLEYLKDKIIYYESSRGCPFTCQYCLSSASSGVRYNSLPRVIADLEVFIKYDVKQVKFVDRTFNAWKKHYLPILSFLAKQKCRTNFHFEIAADLLDEEVLSLLHDVEPGRFQFEVGIQSTNVPTLNEIKRKNDWAKIVHNVKTIQAVGNIHIHLDLIAGLPLESIDDFRQSFNDVYELNSDMLQIGFLKLLRGSGIRQQASRHGYIYMDAAPYEVLANKYISYGEIRRLKIFEDMFNQTYNKSRFSSTFKFLNDVSGKDAFDFFMELTDYWDKCKLNLLAHSTKSLYTYLYNYCRDHYPEQVAVCAEFLKFDALVSDNGTVRPDFLPWNEDAAAATAFWRDEKIVRKYINSYRFSSWRNIKKNYHIEIFELDILEYISSGSLVHKMLPILFLYHNSRVKYLVIDNQDFWTEGKADAI